LPQLFYLANYTDKTAIYPDPEKFDPERFTPDDDANHNPPFVHVPFGSGLRKCLGKEFAWLEMKLFATPLIQKFDWALLPGITRRKFRVVCYS
jgi:cytochrome P450